MKTMREDDTTFDDLQKKYTKCFRIAGTLNLSSGRKISEVVREECVPNKPGVYFIFDQLGCQGQPVYIGKAGTLKRATASWSKQGLNSRLKAKQEQMPRNRFFDERIDRKGLSGMSFRWFVTVDKENNVLPHFAEATAIQAFYDQYRKLPDLNHEY